MTCTYNVLCSSCSYLVISNCDKILHFLCPSALVQKVKRHSIDKTEPHLDPGSKIITQPHLIALTIN